MVVIANRRRLAMLEKLDMSKKLSKPEYADQIKSAQSRLRKLELRMYRKEVPVLCVFEGWDAAGKRRHQAAHRDARPTWFLRLQLCRSARGREDAPLFMALLAQFAS